MERYDGLVRVISKWGHELILYGSILKGPLKGTRKT